MTSIIELYKKKIGQEQFCKYVDRLYRKIHLMHPGESFVIDDAVVIENKPFFVELLTQFILMHPGEFLFSNDYKKFIKQHADRLEDARKIRAKLDRKDIAEGNSKETGSN